MFHPVTNDEIILTKEQKKCVDYVGNIRKDLVVRSAAGGGKSLVLIERAAKYLEEAKQNGRTNSIAIFTYNHVLASCLKEWMQLSQEDEKYIRITTLHEHLNSIYNKIAGRKLGNKAYPSIRENALMDTINECAKLLKTDKYKQWGIRFWYEEFTWMRNMNIFCRDDKEIYLRLDREGRGHTHPMQERDRLVAFEMFCRYQERLRSKGVFDDSPSGDERILFLTHNIPSIPDLLKHDHILIDEAQDQTLAKMIALKSIARLDVTIGMDANQRIYEGRWRFIQAGLTPESKRLSYPFRCTGQIDALAESLKEKNQTVIPDEDSVQHVAPTATGEKPEVVCCKSLDEEQRYVIALIKKWLKDDPVHTIGVICYTNDALNNVGRWLTRDHIPYQVIRNSNDCHYSIREPGVKLCTMHTSKGLEFMRVILPQFYQGMIPQRWAIGNEEEMIRQRCIAYVGMTRAMHQLSIVYNGKKSQFVSEMDTELYVARTFEEAVETELKKPTSMYQKRALPEEDDHDRPQEETKKTESRKKRWSF